ncbi:MAG: PCP reductase family protein [Candidatus Omnitrophica bacterium]|nr:PCP reductase family protein [Candidatus Omnitrophota bacterium]
MDNVAWDSEIQKKFEQLLEKIPGVLRGLAKDKISKRAEGLARAENRSVVGEKDLVDACFVETPFGFHGPMKCDMEEIGIDYAKYGHSK